jgi:hypothetical protein
MAFCSNCGQAVTTAFCTNCGTKVVATVSRRPKPPPRRPRDESGASIHTQGDGTYRMHHPPEPSPGLASTVSSQPAGFFRTPFQILILTYATFGLYGLYWLIRGRRFAELRLGEQITSYWWYLFWLIPIVAFVSGIMSASKIERRVAITNVTRPLLPFGITAFMYFIGMALWRLPDPYWIVSIVIPPILIASMHVTLAKAEAADNPGFLRQKFTVWEWIITILGGAVFILGFWGLFLDLTSQVQISFMIASIITIVAASAVFAALSSGNP